MQVQSTILKLYGYEGSARGVLESSRDGTLLMPQPELVERGQVMEWLLNPERQEASSVSPLGSRYEEFLASVSHTRREIQERYGRQWFASPLCGLRDAIPATRIVPIRLPWAAHLERSLPLVCAVVENVLSLEEVRAMRLWAEQRGELALHQDHLKLKITDPSLAYKLWERLKHLLPDNYHGKPMAGLNDHCRFLKYTPGHYFLPHEDGFTTARDRRDGRTRCSFMSAILYCSDPEEDGGGTTRFIAPDCPSCASSGRCDHRCDHCIDPPVTQGSVLFFAHQLTHAGTEPRALEKFAMRTDLLYFDDG